MKSILSALVALSVLAGAVAPASAAYFPYNNDEPFNSQGFFDYLARHSG